MSKLTTAIFGTIAISLSFGAVQFAMGRDLSGAEQAPVASSAAVNRTAKADRGSTIAPSNALTRTISLQLNGLSETTLLLRIPVAESTRKGAPLPSLPKFGNGKPTVACEPMVSVLTEAAKQLPAGRCVT